MPTDKDWRRTIDFFLVLQPLVEAVGRSSPSGCSPSNVEPAGQGHSQRPLGALVGGSRWR
jgi:hypothetical protein